MHWDYGDGTYMYERGPLVDGKIMRIRGTKAKQCSDRYMGRLHQCQGVEGHEGAHWCYDGRGYFNQWGEDIGSSYCPPDHQWYVHPKDMQSEYYRNFNVEEELGYFDQEPIKPISKEVMTMLEDRERLREMEEHDKKFRRGTDYHKD